MTLKFTPGLIVHASKGFVCCLPGILAIFIIIGDVVFPLLGKPVTDCSIARQFPNHIDLHLTFQNAGYMLFDSCGIRRSWTCYRGLIGDWVNPDEFYLFHSHKSYAPLMGKGE